MPRKRNILVTLSDFDRIVEYLQCSVCNKHMGLPIIVCRNGHNVCGNCADSITKCPTCNDEVLTRNMGLERISLWSGYCCPNESNGCPTVRPIELMSHHIATCGYIHSTCPLNKVLCIVCDWRGLKTRMIEHCEESHKSYTTNGDVFIASSVTDSARIIIFDNEVFLYRKMFEENDLQCVVQKAGISQKKYSATFIFDTYNGLERIVVENPVTSIIENVANLLQSGRCLKLDREVISRFILNDKLCLSVVISKSPTSH